MIPDETLAAFTLPCLANLATREITERCPWLSEVAATPASTKATRRKWQSTPSTRHTFYSAFEGDNPTLRMSKENPPRLLRALVVDYDAYTLSDDTINNVLDDCSPEVSPAFVSRLNSRGIHALWLFEQPVWVMSADFRKRLLNWFKTHLRLTQLFPGLDEKAFHDAMIYYDSGTEWQQLPDSKLITTTTTARAMSECGERSNFKNTGVTVPLDLVANEVEARFPGRWSGDFIENARGVRFWEDGADAFSAIVKPEGMLCYTGEQGFMDWGSIFGRAFIEKFLDNKIGGAAESGWFDGRDFWIWAEQTKAWRVASKEEMARKLKVEYGLCATPDKGDTSSEVDRALNQICTVNLVRTAGPFVQRKPGLIYVDGQRHLNTASALVCQPVDGAAGPDDFPWIENFLETAFVQTKSGHDPQEQLLRFLAWLKRAYVAGLTFNPQQGHVLVLAGLPNAGKTLLADAFIGGVLGGKKDASAFLLSESMFNKALYEVPLWVVNDANAAADPQRRARYNSLVKKVAANRDFEMHAKFRDAVDVSWQGRLVITCNVDPESIQVMPQLDASMEDKVIALRMWSADTEKETALAKGFNDGVAPDAHIAAELPMFLRWLLDCWVIPDWILPDARFGFESYHFGELKDQADAVSFSSNFEEAMGVFLASWFAAHEKEEEWRGNATQLGESMKADSSPVRATAQSYSPNLIGRHLANLVSKERVTRKIINGRAHYVFKWSDWLDARQAELPLE